MTKQNTQLIHQQPTIAAIATPIGRGGVGVIRLSGATAHQIAKHLTKREHDFTPRHAYFCRFYDDKGVVLDEGLLLYFNAPYSFTGEDVIELQGHGGAVLQNLLLARVFELGAKQAQAGEFSYRAFDNDKLDLLQAEAISDAIDATSEAAALSAMRSLTGEFSEQINQLLTQLIHLRLHVEAAIDFPDEEDVDFLADGAIRQQIDAIQHRLTVVLATAKQGQLLKDGIHVVLAGRPNAGKSSLLNRLAGQERAIVTDVAGTTRDTLQETITINGLTLHLTDTAGLRDTEDAVERIGIERAKDAINKADMLLLVYDLSRDVDALAVAKELFGQLPSPKRLLLIGNKLDLVDGQSLDVSHETFKQPDKPDVFDHQVDADNLCYQQTDKQTLYKQVNVSCETSQGIDELTRQLCDMVGFYPSENSLIARTRHVDALKRTLSFVNEADEQLSVYHAGELVAESLRQAQLSLSEITGEFTADDLLGKIFGSFCIGK